MIVGGSGDGHLERSVFAVVAVVAALAVGSLCWIYGAHLAVDEPIRSDAMGYYLYLPAVVLDHDVTMERTAVRSFPGHTADMQGLSRVAPGDRYLDKYPVGEAMMLTPFFAAGHVLALATGARRNGFSWPYQALAAAAGLLYALTGLALLGRLLRRWFSLPIVLATLLLITFGTNLFHYATYDAVFSHAFSFFLVVSLLTLGVAVRERPRLATATSFGLCAGLLVAVRPTNAVALAFPALLGVTGVGDIGKRVRALRHGFRLVAAGAGAFLLALVPQIAYWHAITGRFLVYTYGSEHLDLLQPHVADVLFSVRKGLFFWTPLLIFAVAGVPLLRRRAPGLLLPCSVYLVLHTWVASSWVTWWYGGSFGQRAFVEALPVFAIGLAVLLETVRGRFARPALRAGLVVATLLAVHAMLAYWKQVVPFDGTTWHVYLDSFRHL